MFLLLLCQQLPCNSLYKTGVLDIFFKSNITVEYASSPPFPYYEGWGENKLYNFIKNLAGIILIMPLYFCLIQYFSVAIATQGIAL